MPNATLYHFGVLTSAMHMAWVRQVCGRLESRYRYSARLVYNNFPWPDAERKAAGSGRGGGASGAGRARGDLKKGETLADLYDPLAMPLRWSRPTRRWTVAVDRCYRREPFASERQRVEFLFALYEKLTSPLLAEASKQRRRRRNHVKRCITT